HVLATPTHIYTKNLWGIYLDGASEILVRDNIVYQTQGGGLILNDSRDNTMDNVVTNNIFVDGKEAQLFLNFASKDIFHHNIVYNNVPGIVLQPVVAKAAIQTSNYNLFFSPANPNFATELMQWQALGFDANSKVAAPLFVDYASNDFRLQPSSPAIEMGI